MNTVVQFATVIGFSLAAAGATWLANGSPVVIKPKEVSCDRSLLKDNEICLDDVPENVLWIDARSRSEWEENGLDGSVLWNMDPKEDDQTLEADVAASIFESGAALVVVYCGSEACGTSQIIADRVRNLSLGPSVKVLHGGWDALSLNLMDSN